METFLNDVWQEMTRYYDFMVAITPRLLISILVIVITWVISRLIRNFTDNKLRTRMEDPLLASFLATLVRGIIVFVGLVFAFRTLGLSTLTKGMLAGAGVGAIIIGFALRDLGENFLAGILLAFKRPFRVGDFVETNNIRGNVVHMSIRDTQLKTPDGKDVFLPNASIIKNPLTNFTIDGFLRIDFKVDIAAGSNYEEQLKTIEAAVNQTAGVLLNRQRTTTHVTAILPGRLEVTVNFWIDTFRTNQTQEQIRSNVIANVQRAMEEQGNERG
jgi:small conductance mechanosensitive channel